MLNFEIKPLDPADYERCYHIWGNLENHAQKWLNELINGNRKIFVASSENQFIGEIALVYDKGDPDYTIPGQRAYLSRLVVKEKFRGKGIASSLVDFLIAQAKSENFSELSLGVDIDNHIARHLYKKKGFTTVLFQGEDELGKYVKLLKKL